MESGHEVCSGENMLESYRKLFQEGVVYFCGRVNPSSVYKLKTDIDIEEIKVEDQH